MSAMHFGAAGLAGLSSKKAVEMKAAALHKQRLPQISERADSGRDVIHPELLDADAALDLLPRHRRRHSRSGCGADGIHRRQSAAPGVLIVAGQYTGAGPALD